MPDRLRLFWCRIERFSGPVAVEFLLYFMASVVFAGVKGVRQSGLTGVPGVDYAAFCGVRDLGCAG